MVVSITYIIATVSLVLDEATMRLRPQDRHEAPAIDAAPEPLRSQATDTGQQPPLHPRAQPLPRPDTPPRNGTPGGHHCSTLRLSEHPSWFPGEPCLPSVRKPTTQPPRRGARTTTVLAAKIRGRPPMRSCGPRTVQRPTLRPGITAGCNHEGVATWFQTGNENAGYSALTNGLGYCEDVVRKWCRSARH